MRIKDIVAIVLVIVCFILLGSSYFLSNATEVFINVFSWVKMIVIILTIGYLYIVYMHKK